MFKAHTRFAVAIGAVALVAGGITGFASADASTASGSSAGVAKAATTFKMVRSTGAVTAGCLTRATATVSVKPSGQVEVMTVKARGLPKNTDFDLFVLQVPNAPFGISWYQGDLETDRYGNGEGQYEGRFSVETFAVAPGTAPAPAVHSSPIADATSNPPFAPVHTYHLGLWFNSPVDAAAAGCPNTVTPFNGEHDAGVQAMSTRQFADDQGPLRNIDS